MKPYRYGRTNYNPPANWRDIGEYAAYAKAQEAKLTPEQLKEGHRRVSEFRPRLVGFPHWMYPAARPEDLAAEAATAVLATPD